MSVISQPMKTPLPPYSSLGFITRLVAVAADEVRQVDRLAVAERVAGSSTRRVQGTWAAMAARSSSVKSGCSSSSVRTAKMAFLWMALQRNGFTMVTARSRAAWSSGCSSALRSRSSLTRSRL